MQTTMEIEVEGLLSGPEPLVPAANEEFATGPKPSVGWDPFEVWRTRVKAKKDAVEPPAAIA